VHTAQPSPGALQRAQTLVRLSDRPKPIPLWPYPDGDCASIATWRLA
jgi:hypothetical protein